MPPHYTKGLLVLAIPRQFSRIMLLSLLALALLSSPAPGQGRSLSEIGAIAVLGPASQATPQAYLPLVLKGLPSPQTGIYGRVTYQDAPAAGIHLTLRLYEGSSWSTVAEAITTDDGLYQFAGISALAPGQAYYVRYSNSADGNVDNPNYLWIWAGPPVTSYEPGRRVPGGTFDIADIGLEIPPPRAAVGLPHTFRWAPRSTAPSDSYQFNLIDAETGNTYWWSERLGYVDHYELQALPPGLAGGTPYGWELWVYDPQAGAGQSYYYRSVTFAIP